jgi:hypothetical protein
MSWILEERVEIAHETDLLKGREILLHQLLKLASQRHDCAPVPTHMGECDARDDAAWTDRDVVHVATGITSPEWPGMNPHPQARHICDTRSALVTGPRLRALG